LRWLLGTILAVSAPLLLMTPYLMSSRSLRWWSDATDYAAFAIAICAGLAGIMLLPIHRFVRAALAGLYVPATALLVFFYSLSLVCGLYGDCL